MFDYLISSDTALVRTVIVGAVAYLGVVALIRLFGKRTMARMSGYDWVVTVALGSGLGSAVFSKDVRVADALIGFAVLLGLQFTLTWAVSRWDRLEHFIKATPALLMYRGEYLRDTMDRERVTERDVYEAVRASGISEISRVHAVILETDGKFSVLAQEPGDPGSTSLRFVRGPGSPGGGQ